MDSSENKHYYQIKQRLSALKSNGVEIVFNTYRPYNEAFGENVVLGGMGKEEAPRFPKTIIIDLWDSNTDILLKITNIEDRLDAWEEYTQTKFYRLRQHFDTELLFNTLNPPKEN